jgi:hypothetical protein
MEAVCFSGLGSSDLAHGVVEGQAEDLGTEVDGVPGQIALGPAPIGVFDDQTGIGGKLKLPASRSISWRPRFWSSGASGTIRAARICSRVHLVLGEWMVTVFPPVGLDEHAIDWFEVHDAGLVAHRFDEGTQAEIAGAAQEALAGADDQSQRFLGEGIVAQAGTIEGRAGASPPSQFTRWHKSSPLALLKHFRKRERQRGQNMIVQVQAAR